MIPRTNSNTFMAMAPSARAALPSSAIPELLDLAGEAVFLLDRDPLDDGEPLFQHLHLLAEPDGLAVVAPRQRLVALMAKATAVARAAEDAADHAREHHDRDDQDRGKLAVAHGVFP